ncbi:cytochrome P450 [Streptomyces sp. Go40/10]|uniref:cytochrome P450 n=1 Tax=Streptomyces sp. Go40/10 TaxID=2825844 RepID=UPI001E2DAC76|nr:cytochrome P450 [Streptomyces sp. Go40/10]UFR06943.1 cytochrome P450 [Streptomyces sp. Go40/10]
MTTAESGSFSSAALEEYICLIDELRAEPFPEANFHDDTECGGPEHRVRILRASQEFWDDDDGQAAREADADLRAYLDALIAALRARWGEPLVIDLLPYLRAGLEGEAVSEPINCLSQLTGSMQVWPHRDTGRWLGLAIGQGDKELPLELLAAVGQILALEPNVSGRS